MYFFYIFFWTISVYIIRCKVINIESVGSFLQPTKKGPISFFMETDPTMFNRPYCV